LINELAHRLAFEKALKIILPSGTEIYQLSELE